MGGTVHAQALRRAAEMLGGKAQLRRYLRVSVSDLDKWMAGHERPPTDVFLRAVDVISAPPRITPPQGSDIRQRSHELREASEALKARLARTRERALAVQREVLEGRLLRGPAQPVSAPEFLAARYGPGDGKTMVQAALDAAISATGANMGDVQLTCPEGLRIVAHRGFQQPFLDFFAVVDERSAASCHAAAGSARRIVVPDVASDPIFVGTASESIMAAAGVRAVQSTPIMASGEVVGMLSTHYEMPRELTGEDEEVLDHIARRAAFWLDGGAA